MRSCIVTTALGLLATAASSGAEASAVAAAERILDLQGIDRRVEAMRAETLRTLGEKGGAELSEFALDSTAIKTHLAESMAGRLSRDDLEEVLAFLESPAGGNWLAAQPALDDALEQAVQERFAIAIFSQIRESHIDGNVPATADFRQLMLDGLRKHLGGAPGMEIEFELLQDKPAQVGTAYPKFYVWVTVTKDGTTVEEGAALVAAVEKRKMIVYHFISRSRIASDPGSLGSIFPARLLETIRAKASPSP